MTDPWKLYLHTCPACGKQCYARRKLARRAARALYPGHALRAYRCGRWWHIGHTPRWIVRRGRTGREVV